MILLLYYIGGGGGGHCPFRPELTKIQKRTRTKRQIGQSVQNRQNGQNGQTGQNGQKIGQNGHRTDITYCYYYIITFKKTFIVWFAVCDKYYF